MHFDHDGPIGEHLGADRSACRRQADDGGLGVHGGGEKAGGGEREKWVAALVDSSHPTSVSGPRRMRACDHQASGVGLWGEATTGQAPQPPLMLKITDTFPPEGLYPPCPK